MAAHPFTNNITLPANTGYLALFNDQMTQHWEIDTFDYISLDAGLGQLSFRGKQLEYLPTERSASMSSSTPRGPDRPGPDRPELGRWRTGRGGLTSCLPAAWRWPAGGKDIASPSDKMVKQSPPLDGYADLASQFSLDRTCCTIRTSGLHIGCRTGLSVLAAATDAEIAILDMSIEWSKRAIYRKEDPYYKVTYAKSTCPLHAAPQAAREGRYACQPSVEAVAVEDRLWHLAARPA